ncbi:MAG: FAD-dependent oxidoreductase [Candidatus Delongbacteria bacterium]|jgi:heterodisulfide reductase subunit A-like polyferredoxin|nr:FAD-dependent oxidoreductase [Candidatus Delongbacteria bacterium]
MEEKNKVGSVLVVGAGIAGIQSSLDLAGSGFKVYLMEETPAIGGTMAQLDKTFPTNDCAMCVISPKLVEAGRHLNIDLLTDTDLIGVEGEAGNFSVKVNKRARFVDLDKCTGCGECASICPINTVSIFDEKLVEKTAIYKPYPQASPNGFVIDKNELPPCQISCPSGIHVQGYIALVSQGKYKEAYDLIRQNNPFPSVCGRVCHNPCELDCRRGDYDDPLAIRSIKRFIADYVHSNQDEFDKKEAPVAKTKEKIGIIGAGPAGMTCAYYLAQKGYQVTIFEKDAKAGGMMRSCIPPYRLDRDELDWEIEQILKEGVDLQVNSRINSHADIEALRLKGYKAFFVGIGAQLSKSLRIKGEELEGVFGGIDFLKKVNWGEKVEIGKKVAIVGGGNTAIDCARTAKRLGADVTLIYRRTRREMPAEKHEIVAAEEEGINFKFLTNPIEIIGENGKMKSIKFAEMKLGARDDSGRRRPEPTGKEFTEDFDNVMAAVSQTSDLKILEESNVKTTPWNTIVANELTFGTNIPDVFAGGDVVQGPASVVEAVGQAYEAAISIERYLTGQDMEEGRVAKEDLIPAKEPQQFVIKQERVPMGFQDADKRIANFDEHELGYDEEQVREEAKRCLECGICSGCMECVTVCEAEAIVHDMVDQEEEINVGSIIVATGAEKYDPTALHEYGYGRFENVVTSIQFERILAASGPFEGHLQRPADGKEPHRIAWIQCVGSRSEETPYCSSVCCMYTMKEAIIAKEHVAAVEPTIFYMDIRAYGKDFDKYYDKAKEADVRFVRGRVGKIKEIAETGNLELYYVEDDGKHKVEEFDLVVLSIGLHPQNTSVELSDKLGVRLNEYNFIDNFGISPIQTTRPGIFVCGPAVSPKDIPETVMQASGAVAGAAEILSEVRGTEVTKKVYPDEIDVIGKKPRIGVFVCHCGINISSVVDVKGVVEFAKTLPNVVYASDNLFTCSQDTQEQMKDIIKEYKLNRVIVSSCSPSTHEELFQETMREAGLNKFLFDMANIRNQCSWVHKDDKPAATEKAKRLTKIAVSKGRLLEPLHSIALDVTQTALVVGGGLSGLTSALSIANQGFEVAIIEKSDRTGGNLNRLDETVEGKKVIDYLTELRDEVEDHKLIKLYTDAKITEISGYVGNFTTNIHLDRENDDIKYDHGVIIIATGANESKPTEYMYGKNENVITQLEFEKDFEKNIKDYKKMKNIVLVQCVGSRDENRPYCSRVCCTHSIKNAIRLKELNPKINIHILYRDIRTYGFNEKYYKEARELGIVFVRYDLDSKPVIDIDAKQEMLKSKGLRVTYKDHIMQMDTVMYPDKVILSSAMVPQEDAIELSQMLKIPLNEDNFFMEAHVKLRPVDFSAEGIYLAGLAHSPKNMEETISQAKAAAERATMIISSNEYIAEANIAKVDLDACAGCGMCVSVCPYGAPELFWRNGKEFAHINSALCKGCGSCAAVCPSGAMQQLGFKEEQQLAMLTEALEVW